MNAPHLLRVEVYRSLPDLGSISARLEALNLASRRPSPFDTLAYLGAFLANDEFEEPSRALLLLVAFDGDSPVGFLPLRRDHERILGVPYDAIRFLATHDNDRPRVIARPEDEQRSAEAFYRHLLDVERGWDLLELAEQDADSKLLVPPGGMELPHHHARHFPNNPNATLDLSGRSLREYFGALHRNDRHNVVRRCRRLLAEGSVEVVSSRDLAAVPLLFDLYLDIERRSWKAEVGGHIGRHPKRLAFFRRLMEPGGPLDMFVSLLLLDGVPIAGTVAGAFAGGLYDFEVAFDEGYRDLSPGNAMQLFVVKGAIEQRYRFINMLGNYAYYKARWGATITETHAVQFFRRGSLIHAKALAGEAWRKIHTPRTQWDAEQNLDRKPADATGGPRPIRGAERDLAAATLGALEAGGAKLDRLGGEALRRALPFDVARAGAGARRAEARS